MHPQAQISRRITCSLMIAIYVVFLCFQVKYNLGVASTVKMHQQVANEKHAFSDKLIAKQTHGAVLAKSKTAPTKRFYPKLASFIPQYFVAKPVVYAEQPLRFYHPAPFVQSPASHDAPRRGPPANMFC